MQASAVPVPGATCPIVKSSVQPHEARSRLRDVLAPPRYFHRVERNPGLTVAFDSPKRFLGMQLELAGSELTNPEAAKVFSRVLGKPVRFQKLPMPLVRVFLGKEFYQMFRWFNAEGFKADIAGLHQRYPEVQLSTLEEWLRREGWHKRARRVRPPNG